MSAGGSRRMADLVAAFYNDLWNRWDDAAVDVILINQIQTLVVDENRAAARLRYRGTHDGPLDGLAATGRRFSYAGAAFFTAAEGQLTSAWVLGDLAGLRQQLE
ncbi:MAG: ester cyclase [Actinomycetales bacterium]